MRYRTVVESNIDNFRLGVSTDEDEWELVDRLGVKEAAKLANVSPEVLRLVKENLEYLIELVRGDLEDIWKIINK